MSNILPIVYTIAGSDSSGGAGIQADIKVLSSFHVHGCSITTVVTAQNTLGIEDFLHVPDPLIRSQYNVLNEDLPANVIKLGMLGGAIDTIVDIIHDSDAMVVCDPILGSSSGDCIVDQDYIHKLKNEIIPKCTIITPNIPEAKTILGEDSLSMEEMGNSFLGLGAQSVLIKGGHSKGNKCTDYFCNKSNSFYLESPKIITKSTHGTGCILSSSIAANLAKEYSIENAVIIAKSYLNFSLHNAIEIGNGFGPACFKIPKKIEEYSPNIVSIN